MLKGIRVIDFTQYIPGPYATLRLADLGAEIIKVEPPTGDLGRLPEGKDGQDGNLFRALNRSKKSVVFNLKNQQERQDALELLAQADVVIESFRPGIAEKLGIGYRQVETINPDVIYCSISGYGQNGVMRNLASHDLNYLSLSGVLSHLKDGLDNPVPPGLPFADYIAGLMACEAIIAALYRREQTGDGAYLDISILDSITGVMAVPLISESSDNVLSNSIVSYHLYKTKDERFVSLAAAEPKFWGNFCCALNKESWLEAGMTPPVNENPVFCEMTELFLSRTLEEWTDFSLKVDCCMAPVLEVNELEKHPYFQARESIKQKQGSQFVKIIPYLEGGAWLERSNPPPKLNEHRDEIMRMLLKESDFKKWRLMIDE